MPRGESLRLVRLGKRYGQFEAVRDVSVGIEPGEFVSFLGPSGSGKTTTLMMIAGFETPTSGDVFVGDTNITNLPVHKRNIGVVFQSYALFPHLSVFENVAFPLKMRALAEAEIRSSVLDALELVQLGGYETRMPHELSGGQQQRVALARSLVFKPGVILMDEPLGALDKQLREYMQIELKRIQKSLGTTVIFVTHDQSEALTMSDRIMVMNDGVIAQMGTPEEIYEDPRTKFVASFIGESNFLDAALTGQEGDVCRLDVGGIALKSRLPSQVLGKTAAVTLMVRPEKIFPVTEKNTADNVVEAVIDDVMYWGNFIKYRTYLKAAPGMTLSSSVLYHADSPKFKEGDTVSLGWSIKDSRVIPE